MDERTYPHAINTPLDRSFLRPIQQPLFDAEWYPATGVNELGFFERPQREKFQCADNVKTKNDTNMFSASMLDFPIEFSILGFALQFDNSVSDEDRAQLVDRGSFSFLFSGSREYLNIPIRLLPSRRPNIDINPDSAAAQMEDFAGYKKALLEAIKYDENTLDIDVVLQVAKLTREIADIFKDSFVPFHRFNIGRSALRIKFGEAFGCKASWDDPPKIAAPVRVTASIIGLKWIPL